ncbi:MAG: insulinase family protein [Treponema sp.]|jgi:zinc protease|nr:insulinase family protein [Treponema sp.]
MYQTLKHISQIFILIVMVSCATALRTTNYASLGAPSDLVPFDETIRTGTLANGLQYFILENTMPEDRAYLTLAVKAGSVLEEETERGFAHFVEHMAFNGTARFPEAALINYLRSLGMRFGPEINAYTSFEETIYGIEVPIEKDSTGIKRIPQTALAVIEDWTHAISFDPEEVESEKAVILEEYRARAGVYARMSEFVLPIFYRGAKHADRIPIGLPETISATSSEQLKNFYQKWYRPDTMALIFVGDFDGRALEQSLETIGTFSFPPVSEPLPEYDIPPPQKKFLMTAFFKDPELTATNINLYYKLKPQPVRNDLEGYREELINTLISDMLSQRFHEASSKPESSYVGAGSGIERFAKTARYFILATMPKAGKTETALKELFEQKESLRRYGFSEAELERAKRSVLSASETAFNEKDRRDSSGFIQKITDHFVDGESLASIVWEYNAVHTLIPLIRLKDVNKTVQSYFSIDDCTVFITSPETEPVPSEEQVKKLNAAARKAKVARPDTSIVEETLLDEEPTAGTIIAESQDEASGIISMELENGARVLLKHTTNRNNEFTLYALAEQGTVSVPLEQKASAHLAAELFNASGLGPFSVSELTRKLAGKQVSLSFWAHAFLRGIDGSTTVQDSQTFFELLYLMLSEQHIRPEAFRTVVDQYTTMLAQRSNNPDLYFADTVTQTIYGNNPYFNPLTVESLNAVTIPEAQSFLNQALNVSDYTFVFVGAIDIATLRPLIERYIASVPAQPSAQWTPVPQIDYPVGAQKVIYRGTYTTDNNSRSSVYLASYIRQAFSERQALIAQILTEYLNIRLTESIRESLGGTYSIWVQADATPIPYEGILTVQAEFSCAPSRALELINALETELDTIADGFINDDIVAKARLARIKSWEQLRQNDASLANLYAHFAVLSHIDFDHAEQRPALYESITAADIQEMVQLLRSQELTKVILYPEGWIR